MTFVLTILMPQIAYKGPLTQGKIMILLHILIIPQITHKDNIITLLLITIMPQIIYKGFIRSLVCNMKRPSVKQSMKCP